MLIKLIILLFNYVGLKHIEFWFCNQINWFFRVTIASAQQILLKFQKNQDPDNFIVLDHWAFLFESLTVPINIYYHKRYSGDISKFWWKEAWGS